MDTNLENLKYPIGKFQYDEIIDKCDVILVLTSEQYHNPYQENDMIRGLYRSL